MDDNKTCTQQLRAIKSAYTEAIALLGRLDYGLRRMEPDIAENYVARLDFELVAKALAKSEDLLG